MKQFQYVQEISVSYLPLTKSRRQRMKTERIKTRRRNLVVNVLDCDPEKEIADMVISGNGNDVPVGELQPRKAAVDAFKGIFFVDTQDSRYREQQLYFLLKALKKESCKKGEYVITEGEEGEKVYVIENGELSVTVKGIFKRNLCAGTLFGELALLYNAPRSATVRCLTDCDFWVLDKSVFRNIQHMNVTNAAKSVLQRSQWLMNCPELSNLRPVQMSRLLDSLESERYEMGQVIYQSGRAYDKIILIESGTANVMLEASENVKLNDNDTDTTLGVVRPQVKPTSPLSNSLLRHDSFRSPQSKPDILPALSECSSACESIDDEDRYFSVCTLVEGCVFGLPILQAQSTGRDCGIWKCKKASDKKCEVICPVRIVALDDVVCSTFSVETFEHLFGPLSRVTECTNESSSTLPTLPMKKLQRFDPDKITVDRLLGKGGYGTVVLGQYDQQTYAVKFMSKYEVANGNQIRHVQDERRLLASLDSPFILTLFGTCQTASAIAFVTEYVDRGDMWSAIHENPKYEDRGLPVEIIQFYTSCIVLALTHVHKNHIAFRDLKPENVMIDSNGYLRLIDFGLAKCLPYEKVDCMGEKSVLYKTYTLCGTPEYLAPESVCGMGNDRSVDLWALGIMIYEMLTMSTPFVDEDDPENVDKIIKNISRVKAHGVDIYSNLTRDSPSLPALDLIQSLLKCDPNERIGFRDHNPKAIFDHEFFTLFDFDGVESLNYTPDYIPPDPTDDTYAYVPTLRFKQFKGDNSIFADF
eukprot:CAMPEP_0185025660 /NCGR_PEP_ID=MMETSP1103-20130426/8672_1 /TAXON_ID=36769 /ORGANISM="Paraphysomonas bandaiensis, Strain Caron Lab Isolate" /LENGTH=755 /DNA_ID=CAMNT_0027558925 /DNA_START=104 /DNA_END=2371 /DNA_ORIENTATION=-